MQGDDLRVVDEPINQCHHAGGIGKHLGPLGKGFVVVGGGDDGGGGALADILPIDATTKIRGKLPWPQSLTSTPTAPIATRQQYRNPRVVPSSRAHVTRPITPVRRRHTGGALPKVTAHLCLTHFQRKSSEA